MIKNNIKALLIHFTIAFSCVIISMISNSSAKWSSEEAAKNHHNSMIAISLIILCCSIFLYYYASKKYCNKQRKLVYSLISVSIVTIIGIFLWIITFCIDPKGLDGRLINSNNWVNYSFYIGYAQMFLDESGINNPYIFLMLCFIPSATMCIGLIRKKV